MALELTQNARDAASASSKAINIVFEIDGVDTLFGTIPIKKFVRIGDPGLEVGDPEINPNAFYIGGFVFIQGQETLISYDGTTTKIQQQLQIDKGRSSGVSSFNIRLVDQGQKVTDLITPDESQTPAFDLLGRRARVYLGFDDTAWPEDYITIFRGVITRIAPGAGYVDFFVNSPENKQRKAAFIEGSTELSSNITAGATTIGVASTDDFLAPITPPGGGSPISEFESYIRIEDELIRFTSKNSTQFLGCSRGQFGTAAVAHNSGQEVNSRYRLTGNPLIIAQRLMLSGWQGPYTEEIAIDVFDGDTQSIQSIETDWIRRYNPQIGDFISVSGASNGGNNFSEREIIGLAIDDENNVTISLAGSSIVDEEPTSATFNIRSKHDVYPDGFRLNGDEVDQEQHEFIRNTFLPATQYDLFLKETIEDGREYIEEKIYSPISCFGIPRKARASVGYTIGPIPGQNIRTFNDTNVKNASKLKINRSTENYFFNEIVYRFDESRTDDRFLGGTVFVSQTSKNRIENRASTLIIDGVGLRTANGAASIANAAANRRLDRYQFGAEYLDIETSFGSGFTVEIGDIVVFDGENLQVSDIKSGTRAFESRLMEVNQKTLDLRTGAVRLSLVDSNFDGQSRYGLISPASIIKGGISTSRFILEVSFGNRLGVNEFQKYENLVQPWVAIRSPDFSFREERQINSFSGNIVQLETPLSQTPQAGWIMELADYSTVTRAINLIYGFISDNNGDDFPDTEPTYVLL